MAIEKYFQTIDGSQIFYQIFGKETNYPLVLLHGNGNDHTFFNYINCQIKLDNSSLHM